jgi:hypothetical protein
MSEIDDANAGADQSGREKWTPTTQIAVVRGTQPVTWISYMFLMISI